MTGRPGGRSRRCASCHGGGKGPRSPVAWDGDGEDTGSELSAFSPPRLLPPHGELQRKQELAVCRLCCSTSITQAGRCCPWSSNALGTARATEDIG